MSEPTLAQVFARLAPGRSPHGVSAVLLPYTTEGRIDWAAFERLIARTAAAGLDPAVNMDTGFVDLLGESERLAVLDATRSALGTDRVFYAGAFPGPAGAAGLDDAVRAYQRALEAIEARAGVPVIVQCPALRPLPSHAKAEAYGRILEGCARALAFELSPVFAPHGEIWDDETFARILALPKLLGAKHSSLDRATELRRLAARDRARPAFRVYTGNDLAIDLVLYGSDYLLGLSTFAPEAFAARDRALAQGDLSFLARNDALQHLGNVGFRAPVPAYKHAAAQFLHLTGQLASDAIHPRAPRRPASDRVLLFDCALRLGLLADPERVWAERVVPFVRDL